MLLWAVSNFLFCQRMSYQVPASISPSIEKGNLAHLAKSPARDGSKEGLRNYLKFVLFRNNRHLTPRADELSQIVLIMDSTHSP